MSTANPRLADARNIAAVLLLVGGAAGALWTVLSWAGTRVGTVEASQIHDTMRIEYRTTGQELNAELVKLRQQWANVARDVEITKCFVDPSKTAKEKRGCGLGSGGSHE